MIEYGYLLALLFGVVTTYVVMELYPKKKKLSVDEVLKQVDTLELEKKIPELMKKERRQFLVMPVKTSQNVRGIVTDEQHNVYDPRTGMKRLRLTVLPLNGDKKIKEWGDYYNPLTNKLEDICMASGTVFLSLAKGANVNDDKNNIAWYLLPPNMVNSLKRDADRAEALELNLRTRESQFESAYNRANTLQSRLKEREIAYRHLEIEYSAKCSAVTNLETTIERLKEENNMLETRLNTVMGALETYKKFTGVPANEVLGIDTLISKKFSVGVEQHRKKGEAGTVAAGDGSPPPENVKEE